MESLNLLQPINDTIQAKLSEALVSLTQQTGVSLHLQQSSILPVSDVHSLVVGDGTESAMAVYIPIMGELTGDIFVFLTGHSAALLADLMIGNPLGTTKLIGEFESSAIKELGNITTGAIVTELSNALGISMMLTVPNLAKDMPEALIDQVLIEYGSTAPNLLAIQFPFTIDPVGVRGYFLIMFDSPSSERIAQQVSRLTNQSHG